MCRLIQMHSYLQGSRKKAAAAAAAVPATPAPSGSGSAGAPPSPFQPGRGKHGVLPAPPPASFKGMWDSMAMECGFADMWELNCVQQYLAMNGQWSLVPVSNFSHFKAVDCVDNVSIVVFRMYRLYLTGQSKWRVHVCGYHEATGPENRGSRQLQCVLPQEADMCLAHERVQGGMSPDSDKQTK